MLILSKLTVVNLTLVDLPGLTKVAIGKSLLTVSVKCMISLILSLQMVNLRALWLILRIWFVHILRRYHSMNINCRK